MLSKHSQWFFNDFSMNSRFFSVLDVVHRRHRNPVAGPTAHPALEDHPAAPVVRHPALAVLEDLRLVLEARAVHRLVSVARHRRPGAHAVRPREWACRQACGPSRSVRPWLWAVRWCKWAISLPIWWVDQEGRVRRCCRSDRARDRHHHNGRRNKITQIRECLNSLSSHTFAVLVCSVFNTSVIFVKNHDL